jgi:tetratricopeptide (TPR) repeat protein
LPEDAKPVLCGGNERVRAVTELKLKVNPCPCGSGLRAVRCCEMDASALPVQDNTALLETQGVEATKLFNEKKYAEAEALALRLLDLAPNQRTALRLLFEIRKAQNKHEAATALGKRLAGLPGVPALRAQANTQYAQYLVGQGRHAAALPIAAAALKAAPKDATAQHVMGVVLTETGSVQEGEAHYRRALKLLGRDDGLVLANLAWNLKLQGRLDESAGLYEAALALRADNKRGVGGQAQVEFGRGNRDKAVEVLDAALAQWADDRTLRLLRVMADLALHQPQAVLDRLGSPDGLLAPEILARAQAFEQLGQLPEAVTAWSNARRMQRERSGLAYRPEALQAQAAVYKAYFTADRAQVLPRARTGALTSDATPGAFTPVFLLGFARSGSALLEQLLAQLPGFAMGDEFGAIGELAKVIPRLTDSDAAYPEALDDFLIGDNQELPGRLRGIYEDKRERLGLMRPGVRFITDRAFSNFWHIGLIKLLYPEAPIIHVLRHPYDLMLANMAQDRKFEGNAQAGLPAVAHYYGLHADMIRHFRGQLTLRYMPVRYEELVAEPERVLREVLDFIGAEGSVPPGIGANSEKVPDPLPAHFAGRTALHGNAAYKHRAYLAAMPHLFDEVKDALAPLIDELGYAEEPVS